MAHDELEPMLQGAGFTEDDDFDYVFLVVNPFISQPSGSLYSRIYTQEAAEKTFLAVFKTTVNGLSTEVQQELRDDDPVEDDVIKDIRARLQAFLDSCHEEIIFSNFAEEVLKTFIHVLQEHLKLEVKVFYSRDKDEIFIKVRSTEQNLKIQADLDDYKLQFKDKEHRHLDKECKRFSPYAPFERFNDKYKFAMIEQNKEELFKRYNESGEEDAEGKTLFRQVDRVRLIYSAILDVVDVSVLQSEKIIKSEFAIHNAKALEKIKNTWAGVSNINFTQDPNQLREYFGEKVALYFAWLNWYIIWLIAPAIIGLILFIIIEAHDDLDDKEEEYVPGEVCVIILTLWLGIGSTLFDQMWVRREKFYAWEWGQFDIVATEPQRPEFKGELAEDPITGKFKKLTGETKWQRRRKSYCSASIIFLFICIVIAAVVSIFLYRATLNDEWGPRICAFCNAIQIKIMNYIYGHVAKRLTNWENHEVESHYNDALATKLFLFQFVNSYNSLFYIAFLKSAVEGCRDGDCMQELTIQLSTIFITNLFMNIVELGTPFIMQKLNVWLEERKLKKKQEKNPHRVVRIEMSYTEEQSKHYQYETPMSDYMELVIQYGYVILFSSSFALTPLLAYILNLFEVRVDAFKLCYLTRRPYPQMAENIGIWYLIIQCIAWAGIITNVGIMVFTAHCFDTDLANKWLIFLIIEHCLFLFKFLLSSWIPDTPYVVNEAKQWQERVVNEKMFNKIVQTSKQRKARDLNFADNPQSVKVSFDEDSIHKDNY